MKTITQNPIRIAAAVALFAVLSTGARAQEASQLHVKYADLNVNSPAGATLLYQRIRGAAEQVCGVPGHRDLARLVPAKACAAQAIAEAVATVNNPTLTGIYEAKMGGIPAVQLAAAR